MEQQIKLIVPRDGLLTRLVGLVILLQTLLQIGLAFGVGEFRRRFDLFTYGAIGFSLEVVAAGKEGLKRMKLLTPPAARLASRALAGSQAAPPIGGPADTVKAVRAEVVKLSLPSLGRAMRRQFDFEDSRTLRLNRHQEGALGGKHLRAEIKHHGLVGPRYRGGDGASIGV